MNHEDILKAKSHTKTTSHNSMHMKYSNRQKCSNGQKVIQRNKLIATRTSEEYKQVWSFFVLVHSGCHKTHKWERLNGRN